MRNPPWPASSEPTIRSTDAACVPGFPGCTPGHPVRGAGPTELDEVDGWSAIASERTWCLMSMCSRNGVRVPHVVCSRNLGPQGDGFVLGGDDEGLLDPVDVPGQVRRIGLGVEPL